MSGPSAHAAGPLAARGFAPSRFGGFHQAEDKDIGIAWRNESIRGCGQRLGRRRLHEIRRDDDDQLGLVALELAAAEEQAEDRKVAKPGKLLDIGRNIVLQQARDGEGLPVAQLKRGLRPSRLQRGNWEPIDQFMGAGRSVINTASTEGLN